MFIILCVLKQLNSMRMASAFLHPMENTFGKQSYRTVTAQNIFWLQPLASSFFQSLALARCELEIGQHPLCAGTQGSHEAFEKLINYCVGQGTNHAKVLSAVVTQEFWPSSYLRWEESATFGPPRTKLTSHREKNLYQIVWNLCVGDIYSSGIGHKSLETEKFCRGGINQKLGKHQDYQECATDLS